ncbi:DNA methyltransferase [uncultured Megasphaera sp.]|uniref:TRM11 family SAM-dependent methyltransferase n=1 Tax=uncultured Megasphaera sp. TaxID=165188 RepID=UPI0025FEF85A|nr:DNA methyltransferase [uncultured Megasphaera sp.]
MIKKWAPENFELETTTIWSFPNRGNWATHDGKYRGNWSPYISRNLLLRYTNIGDLVLDPFIGGGTTAIEAKLLQRNCIGVDVNPKSLELCKQKCAFSCPNSGKLCLHLGDARRLDFLSDESVDFICTHPPYADMIIYSKDIQADISRLPVQEFLKEMEKVAYEAFRVLKNNKFCAILMGDMRKKGHIIPLSFYVMQIFINAGFSLKEMIIKEQHNCKATGFWRTRSMQYNFLLIAHEHLFVFHK